MQSRFLSRFFEDVDDGSAEMEVFDSIHFLNWMCDECSTVKRLEAGIESKKMWRKVMKGRLLIHEELTNGDGLDCEAGGHCFQ